MSLKKRQGLSDQVQRYIELRAGGMDKKPAALAAGYSESYSAAIGRLEKNPSVAAAIDAIRQKGCELAAYTLTKAMEESLQVIEFAKAHKNPMAYFKAVEHRAKLSGLLIEQLHIKQEVIDLRSALQEARTRVINPSLALCQRATVVDPFAEEP
jgi:phage terminase small subunit